jgi:hypothetical protein
MMKPFAASLIAITGALALTACAGGGYGHRFGGGDLAYDAYYDDAYGPYIDGYWGADDVFMYRHERNGEMVRDEAHHFRHDNATGFHGVRTAHAGAAHPAPVAGEHRPG